MKDKTQEREYYNLETNVKMFLFTRWMATCYADEHMDNNNKSQHDEEFDSVQAISVLNRERGEWYKTQLKFFNEVVYPNYMENGSVKSAREFLK